ncbi:hypothetical protein DFH11DRAFT_1573104 [Phellopilus nigrolimitatus]|nr:hypothetical protein DFH11DRAFT_1573104 [Phellopilus nigrolimitatus]
MAVEVTSIPVDVCRSVQCDKCGKTTWAGCGMHKEAVMADVKEDNKCLCPRDEGSSCIIS